MYDEKALARFWSKVDVRGPDECWPWKAPASSGYGRFWNGSKTVLAPRVALELTLGRQLLPRMDACHKPVVCHNRACCNPAHLYEGTRSQNMQDKALDGTHRSTGDHKGERNESAKLTKKEAKALLRLRGSMANYRAAGRIFGISGAPGWPHLERRGVGRARRVAWK